MTEGVSGQTTTEESVVSSNRFGTVKVEVETFRRRSSVKEYSSRLPRDPRLLEGQISHSQRPLCFFTVHWFTRPQWSLQEL